MTSDSEDNNSKQKVTPTGISNHGSVPNRLQSPAAQVHAENTPDPEGAVSEEKIFVTVRVRPMSKRESAMNDENVWHVPNDHTLTFTEPVVERSPYPATYHFDRVFGPSCQSQRVYAEGAREVVLSSLNGLNASIFAYGMTSSGKTFTMKAVMEHAVLDIFEHIQNNPHREYMIRVSALEIYNEVVKDLLKPESGALRLLDDPDRGTVVEKLSEEVARSSMHLRQILADCEAQRQIGETQLNDASSRSHQIIRLTVESCPRLPIGSRTSLEGVSGQLLIASLNFIDLAGSERASQTHSEGTRLKEGGHINRSLLTLGTVIRKLSGGNKAKAGHIPYRDSKLTRILQHSLGGNSRTAIICTMSPARTHVDQSRNTLSFATRAKEVTNTAHVNLMVTDKLKVKQLELEVARLEAELKHVPSLAELEELKMTIQMLEQQLVKLKTERDGAVAQVGLLQDELSKLEAGKGGKMAKVPRPASSAMYRLMRRSGNRSRLGKGGEGKDSEKSLSQGEATDADSLGRLSQGDKPVAGGKDKERRRQRKAVTRSSLALVNEIRKLEVLQDQLGEDATLAMEALTKEIECLRLAQAGMNQEAAETIAQLQAEVRSIQEVKNTRQSPPLSSLRSAPDQSSEVAGAPSGSSALVDALREEISRLESKQDTATDSAIAVLEEKLDSMQQSLDQFWLLREEKLQSTSVSSDGKHSAKRAASPTLTASRLPSSRGPSPQRNSSESSHGKKGGSGTIGSNESVKRNSVVDMRRMQSLFKTAAEDNIKSIRNYVTELKERVAKLHHQKELLIHQVLDLEETQNRFQSDEEDEQSDGGVAHQQQSEEQDQRLSDSHSKLAWPLQFERDMIAIILLWHKCHVSLIHRTQFYLLMNGDPADSIYLEVEHRRLVWLLEQCQRGTKGRLVNGEYEVALRKEREMISKKMKTRFTAVERMNLFQLWGIPETSKQRKLQLAQKLWTEPTDIRQVEASANLVGHVMKFPTDDKEASREFFALQFNPLPIKRDWL